MMAIGQLIAKPNSSKNLIFFGLFLDFALIEFHYILYLNHLTLNFQYLDLLSISAFFLLGPILLFLTKYSVSKNFKFVKQDIFHLIPFLSSIILIITGFIAFPEKKDHLIFGYAGNYWFLFIGVLAYVSFISYLIIVGTIIYKNHLWHKDVLLKQPTAIITLILFASFIILTISDLFLAITSNRVLFNFGIITFTSIVIAIFFINFRYPDFSSRIQYIVGQEKQKRSYLKGIDLNSVEQMIKQLMDEKEIFQDEDISLAKLADKLNLSTHQLSEYVNEILGKKFNDFINEYRIEKAKKMLKEKPEYTILAIGFEVGFKSKSAFNNAFFKCTGKTPSEFRKNKQS